MIVSRTLFAAALASALCAGGAIAQDCPNAQSARDGFVVERGHNQRSEVHHDGAVVRTMMRYAGRALLETTQFEGIFELDRLDRGRRSSFQPKSDLKALFPLRPGKRVTAEFEFRDEKDGARSRVVLLEVKASEDFYVGACKYRVLKIERSETRSEAPPRLVSTDFYSPDLKYVLAKEWPQRNGRATMIKFDKIYILRR